MHKSLYRGLPHLVRRRIDSLEQVQRCRPPPHSPLSRPITCLAAHRLSLPASLSASPPVMQVKASPLLLRSARVPGFSSPVPVPSMSLGSERGEKSEGGLVCFFLLFRWGRGRGGKGRERKHEVRRHGERGVVCRRCVSTVPKAEKPGFRSVCPYTHWLTGYG